MEKLVDVIHNGEIATVSEKEAREEGWFVLREHLSAQEKEKVEDKRLERVVTKPLKKWNTYEKDYLKNNVVKDLIDNFHWEVVKARKAKNMTRIQLANALGVPEGAIKMVETGELPSDNFVLINKVQSYLGINLRRDGKSFDAPNLSNLNISIAELQRRKEAAAKNNASDKKSDNVLGLDIEIIE